MQQALTVCGIIATVLGVLYAYRAFFMVAGVFCTKRYAAAKHKHRYAIVIAARNEESVIGNLLDSIAMQDYPSELLRVFVVADNCTDQTASIARRHGAVCYERQDERHRTKGYALQFLFERIARDYTTENFDGYFIFDADNLLKRDYISRMNDAFDGGERVVVSYRSTKNMGDGWLSASYALHWIRTCRLEHCARSFFGISSRIQGTGVLFAREFVADGWHYTSLTEDRAFSSDVVTAGVRIGYQHDAIFYDEQPTSLPIALRQRLRWAKGNLQAFYETGWALFGKIFRKGSLTQRVSAYDMLLFNFPYSAVSVPIKLVQATLTAILAIMGGLYGGEWLGLLAEVLQILIFEHFSCILLGGLLFILERKRIPRLAWYQYVWYSLTFPLFGIIGDLATLIALFVKVTWKPIPHRSDISLSQLEARHGEQTKETGEKSGSESLHV